MPSEFDELSFENVEAAFLAEHWRYGAMAHRVAADALREALADDPPDYTAHLLFARMFSEFVAALEAFGAWGWSIKLRRQRGGLVRAFLSYRGSDVGSFFRLVGSDDSGDLSALLDLPPHADVYEVVAAVGREAGLAFSEEEYDQTLAARYRNLKEASEQWFSANRVVVDAYNKAKHGATLARLYGRENPRRFQIVLANDDGDLRYADFTLTDELTSRVHRNIQAVTQWTSHLVSLMKMLSDADRLY